jgi:hypothetical protein
MSCTGNYPLPMDSGCRVEARLNEPPQVRRNKFRSIKIEGMDAGYIVNIGCQTFAIESKQSLITKLSAYINDPENVEIAWMNEGKLPKK